MLGDGDRLKKNKLAFVLISAAFAANALLALLTLRQDLSDI